MRLLLVEDAEAFAAPIREGLARSGFVVDHCADGEGALALAATTPYVVVLLDRRLPDLDGLDVCRRLRAGGSTVPILMLTARDTLADRVEGLDGGADDYLVKPFAFAELLARVRALARRHTPRRSNTLKAGRLTLDLTEGCARVDGAPVPLSAKEVLVLTALLRHPGRLVTHALLGEQVWDLDGAPSPEVVRAHVKNLRKKLAQHGVRDLVSTVHGLGYRVAD